jgi:hypothetical protein
MNPSRRIDPPTTSRCVRQPLPSPPFFFFFYPASSVPPHHHHRFSPLPTRLNTQACEPCLLLLLLLLLSDDAADVAADAYAHAQAAGAVWVARREAQQGEQRGGRRRLDLLQPGGGGEEEEEEQREEKVGLGQEGGKAGGEALRCMVRALFPTELLRRSLDDVGHWTLRMRHRAILLLADLVCLAGTGQVTASLPPILATLLSTLVTDGEEVKVAQAVERAMRALGTAGVAPGAVLDEVLPQVRARGRAHGVLIPPQPDKSPTCE